MRKFLLTLSIFFVSFSLFALPGVVSYIPDTSGEYVYYRDYTFVRESYVGFLYYDDATYAARFYSPANLEKQLVEQDVRILFNISTDSNYVEMTGERFLTSITPDDTPIVNYLHDIFYELSARRSNLAEISSKTEGFKNSASTRFNERGLEIEEDFVQFGGDVVILYDYLLPIFNVKKITSSSQGTLFKIVTAGMLVSSEDNSFFDFFGIPDVLTDSFGGEKIVVAEEKNIFELKQENNGKSFLQQITFDSAWEQATLNLWLLRNDALFTMNFFSFPQDTQNYWDALQRRVLLGTQNSYAVWDKIDFFVTDEKISVVCYYYQNKTNKTFVTKDFKTFIKMDDETCAFSGMTVFDSSYRKNHSYFDAILKTYKIQK